MWSNQKVKGTLSCQIVPNYKLEAIIYSTKIGAIFGWLGGPENGNFPLLYVVKMS